MRCRSRPGRSRRVRRRSSDAAMVVFVEEGFVRTTLTTLTEVGKRAGAVKGATESVRVSGVLNAAISCSARV